MQNISSLTSQRNPNIGTQSPFSATKSRKRNFDAMGERGPLARGEFSHYAISSAPRTSPCLLRKLGGKDIDFLDGGRLCEQVVRLRHEQPREAAREIRLPARLVREGVEDAERRGSHPDSKPRGRGRLVLDHSEAITQKAGDVLLFPRFRLKTAGSQAIKAQDSFNAVSTEAGVVLSGVTVFHILPNATNITSGPAL
jgi:hypothetical protein